MIRNDVLEKITDIYVNSSNELKEFNGAASKVEEFLNQKATEYLTDEIKDLIKENPDLFKKTGPDVQIYNIITGMTKDDKDIEKTFGIKRSDFVYWSPFNLNCTIQTTGDDKSPLYGLTVFMKMASKKEKKQLKELYGAYMEKYESLRTLKRHLKELLGNPALTTAIIKSKLPQLYNKVQE